MNQRKLLAKLARGETRNVSFSDFLALVRDFGFELARVSGSHHIFVHPLLREQVNLQNRRGEAKPYQVRQFLKLVERYNLQLEDGS